MPARFYLTTGYSYVDTDRRYNFFNPTFNGTANGENRLADTVDHIYKADLRWRGTGFISARIGYEKFVRDAAFPREDRARSFDLASKSRNTYKVLVDISPVEALSVDLGYNYKNTDYKRLDFGLKTDWRNEFTASADYTIGKMMQVFVYGDIEKIRTAQNQTVAGDPANPWSLTQKETDYDYGAGANIFLMPKSLTLKLQYDYASSRGNADFTLPPAQLAVIDPRADNGNIDIHSWDNSKRSTYLMKLIYNVTRKISVAAGYMYEKFTYSDAELNEYTLAPGPTGTVGNSDFLTGAFRDQSYTANIIFASLSYKF